MWSGRRILVGVCGGIAAYRVCELVSALSQAGADVRVVLTAGAQAFISPLTLATLSRQVAYTDAEFWHYRQGRPLHIELAEWAEAILIAPLTANTLAKLALGLADNLLTNLCLATAAPLILAPAMNTDMWQQPTVQQHWGSLLQRHWGLTPSAGRLACDAVGVGRLVPVPVLEETLAAFLWTRGRRDWQGRTVLVTGGATREFWDPVRFLSNPASGRMGAAVANAVAARGAQVIYCYGSGDPPPLHPQVTGIPFTAAADLEALLDQYFPQVDTVLMAAAVSDVRPQSYHPHKQPKANLGSQIPLSPVPDLVQALAQRKQSGQRIIAWAAQSGDPVPPAREKLHRKQVDAIVANAIDQPESGFGSEWNQGTWITPTQEIPLPHGTKVEMAHRILDLALTLP
ncbi:MAG: bifunctional phosphopantothenoylcysteine decarboxylase/phosphopantothenate--cysteine ligase CoaBC [Synechococcales cyanobacterium]